MKYPAIKINLSKLATNSKVINDRCARLGISVVAVTKCVLADIRIVETFTRSGINIFGDSRLLNLKKLKDFFGSSRNLIMLRTPMLTEVEELISICSTSVNTQIKTVKKISESCYRKGLNHQIIIMVETDDEREGLLPKQVIPFCKKVSNECRNINIWALGTNARCISSKRPTTESIKVLTDLKEKIKNILGIDIPVISGGNSSVWNLIENNKIPGGVNQVRIGEAILFGHETVDYRSIEATFGNCFSMESEVIEVKRKKGIIYKIILGLGLQDVNFRYINCKNPYLSMINQSSDHTILGIKSEEDCEYIEGSLEDKKMWKREIENMDVGSIISFNLNYFGLLSLMSSPFVKKIYIGG